jgi:hypothetical protein
MLVSLYLVLLLGMFLPVEGIVKGMLVRGNLKIDRES